LEEGKFCIEKGVLLMFKKKIFIILVTLVLVAALSVGCGQKATPTPDPDVEGDQFSGEIKFGAVMSTSGALAAMGSKMADSIRMAEDEINAAGGINGKKLTVLIEDDATDPATSLAAVKKLVEINGVQFVLGPMISGGVNTAGPYVSEKQVLLITPSATSPLLTGAPFRDFVFRTCPSDDLQGTVMAQIALGQDLKKLVVFTMDNMYGVGLGEAAQRALVAGGAEVLEFIKYDENKMDYLTELTRIKGLNPDGVIHVGYNDDARVVYKQALNLGLDEILWVAPDGIYGSGMLVDEASAQFMATAVIGTRPGALEEDAVFEDFASKFRAKYNSDPEVYCDTVYDAVFLLAQAIERAGSEETAVVRDALVEVGQGYQGASGSITFNTGGDRVSGIYEVWKVIEENGEYKFVATDMISME
jgi:ABC-type branched-subunit amino acid transport system substrate-binding protein